VKVLRTLPCLGILLVRHDLENRAVKKDVAHVLSFNICCFLIVRHAGLHTHPKYDHHCFRESDKLNPTCTPITLTIMDTDPPVYSRSSAVLQQGN